MWTMYIMNTNLFNIQLQKCRIIITQHWIINIFSFSQLKSALLVFLSGRKGVVLVEILLQGKSSMLSTAVKYYRGYGDQFRTHVKAQQQVEFFVEQKRATAHRHTYTRISRTVQLQNFQTSSIQPWCCTTWLSLVCTHQEILCQPESEE
jgi:hypothetical protein